MLSSVATAILNRVLGEFIEDLDPANLSIALGRGTAPQAGPRPFAGQLADARGASGDGGAPA